MTCFRSSMIRRLSVVSWEIYDNNSCICFFDCVVTFEFGQNGERTTGEKQIRWKTLQNVKGTHSGRAPRRVPHSRTSRRLINPEIHCGCVAAPKGRGWRHNAPGKGRGGLLWFWNPQSRTKFREKWKKKRKKNREKRKTENSKLLDLAVNSSRKHARKT